jgi:hypothetical protein
MGGDWLYVRLGIRSKSQIERNVNLRLRVILNAVLRGAMRMARSCNRPVDILDWGLGRGLSLQFIKDKNRAVGPHL